MACQEIIARLTNKLPDFFALSVSEDYADETGIKVAPVWFADVCITLHKILPSPVMMFFALDERQKSGKFTINCVFLDPRKHQWITVSTDIPGENPSFDSLSKDIYSASLFEREMREMFGIEPKGNPDLRRLNLHDEAWPQGNYPLRKDFKKIQPGVLSEYKFSRVEGEGIFEVPVGPVHAGIIGPGHFRFSVAGEPIINLETRLGFTHRGVEKISEGKTPGDTVRLSECVSGDSSFAHSTAFVSVVEKISGACIPNNAQYSRAIFLELERMYNHVNDIGGIALDVGFSFPAAFASIIKESILQLNEKLTGSRYLKKVNTLGGVLTDINQDKKCLLLDSLKNIMQDFNELYKILNSSVSFMDRVDITGVLKRKTAEDLGIVGLAGRASGIPLDLRKYFPGVYREAGFKMITRDSGDVLARLQMRFLEFEESARLINVFLNKIKTAEENNIPFALKEGRAIGYVEGWRGPVLYWLEISPCGLIDRCKIVDASFHNWQGLSYAVLGNIIPDFPLCNKSFDLSYSGNDL